MAGDEDGKGVNSKRLCLFREDFVRGMLPSSQRYARNGRQEEIAGGYGMSNVQTNKCGVQDKQ